MEYEVPILAVGVGEGVQRIQAALESRSARQWERISMVEKQKL